MTKKHIILRIAVIIAVAEYFIMLLFAYILPVLPTAIEAIVDVVLLVLITTPLIYFRVINPYIVANHALKFI
ncbi:hypothetical protein [uncultured Legionella sp.]|uniref:hypothetical protein n=1 Tax=uncultured Legionella sp. TaxID=210934 RepID=UPI00260EA6D1|nr:hypothetical protein [uncultured Legionella sp.]